MIGRALIHVPATAKHGDTIEIKALISHVMETGYRIGITGQPIPRDIIEDFVCTYNGEAVLHADPAPEQVTFDTIVDTVNDNVRIRANESI